jgi:hypothetical protein
MTSRATCVTGPLLRSPRCATKSPISRKLARPWVSLPKVEIEAVKIVDPVLPTEKTFGPQPKVIVDQGYDFGMAGRD